MNPNELLAAIMKSVVDISDDEIQDFVSIAKSKQIKKGYCFIHMGQVPKSIAFVVSGLFRYYYMDIEGNEFTKGFMLEKSLITSYSAMTEKRGSYFAVEALEDSHILEMDYQQFKAQFRNKMCLYKFSLYFVEKGYCYKETREREFLLFNAEKRYRSFLDMYPGLDQRIPQKLIASYIGITPVSLSRIRKKMGLINKG